MNLHRSKVSLEDLLRIVEICRVVERRGVDPFEVDVKSSLERLKKYLPHLKLLDELLLDAEAINQISSIIKLQSDWIKRRSSSLFMDPIFVELKIRMLDSKSIVEAFLNSWHPIVGMNQIFPQRLKEAVDYWNNLLPLGERWREDFSVGSEVGSLEIDDLIDLKVASLENFDDKVRELLKELEDKLKFGEKIDYWDFVCSDTFEKTLERAYIISFILTEGYATLLVDPLEERTYIIPLRETSSKKRHHSLPIALNYESFRRLKEGKS
ncbi:MAG: hypothetical protein L6N95_00135 [Candidatus Methylarchaceae archaeon HK01B]|nr:hypothetical protein [Candidatus Methylarchaceae archaeon HK01B]